jgi:hypothetical protein
MKQFLGSLFSNVATFLMDFFAGLDLILMDGLLGAEVLFCVFFLTEGFLGAAVVTKVSL